MNPLVAALAPVTSRVRRDATAVKIPGAGSRWTDETLTDARLSKHIESGPGRGCCPIKAGESVTRLALLDLDSHSGETDWPAMTRAADVLMGALEEHGLRATPGRSSGGRGIHLICIWDEPQDAYSVREHLRRAIASVGFHNGAGGGVAAHEVEIFPKQDSVPADGYGNQFILPLHGESAPLHPTSLEVLPQDAAVTLPWDLSDPVPVIEKPERAANTHAPSTALPELREALAAIPQETDPLDYDQWRNVIFAIHHETNGDDDGLALAHEFSARSSKYEPDLLDERIWPYIDSDRESVITGASILHLAREHGFGAASASDFDDVSQESEDFDTSEKRVKKIAKFIPIPAAQFAEEHATRWLIKGVLPAAVGAPVLAVMYGASGSGKSFKATDMAIAIARGIQWRHHRVTKGRVVYVCAEGSGGYRKRLKAYAQHHGIPLDAIDVFVVAAAPNLLEADDVSALVRAIHTIGPVALVVIDTLAQATAGGNENSGEDMGRAIGHCRTISEVLHCTVLLVHHSGKDDTKGARGHSSLKAAADTEFEVVRTDDRRAMRLSKQKDGEDSMDMGFELSVITLGLDEDGDPITSCVVEHNEDTVADVRAAKATAEGKDDAKLAYDALVAAGLAEGVKAHKINPTLRDQLGWTSRKSEKAMKALSSSGAAVCVNGTYRLPDDAFN